MRIYTNALLHNAFFESAFYLILQPCTIGLVIEIQLIQLYDLHFVKLCFVLDVWYRSGMKLMESEFYGNFVF